MAGSTCITITPGTVGPGVRLLTDITSDQVSPVPEGQDICYTVFANDNPGSVPYTITVSGTDAPDGQICASYDGTTNGPVLTTFSGVIPDGQASATHCYARDAGSQPGVVAFNANLASYENDCIGGSNVTQALFNVNVRPDGTFTISTDTNISSPQTRVTGTWYIGDVDPSLYTISFNGQSASGSAGLNANIIENGPASTTVVNEDIQIFSGPNLIATYNIQDIRLSVGEDCP